MTDRWDAADLDRFGATVEVDITTVGRDGTLRPWVQISIVRIGGDLYIRSFRGCDGAWYRHLSATGEGRLRRPGRDLDVRAEAASDAALTDDIDRAYAAKYTRSGGRYVAAMTSDTARATTLRLTPR
jgi:hypothetical protein